MHMPPPVHGAAMVGQWIHDSKVINQNFDCYYINPSVSNNIAEVGKIRLKKLYIIFSLIYHVILSIYKIKPDLCYYTPTSDGWGIYKDALIIFILKIFCKRVVLHFHNKGVKKYSSHKSANLAYRIIFRNVKVILISNELYSDISDYIPLKEVFFLPNAIPQTISDEQFKIVIKKRQSNHSRTRILFLSNLLISKGIYVLLEACKELTKDKVALECHYIGNSGDVTIDTFKAQIEQKGMQDRIFVHGPKYGNEKEIFFINSDIFIFPTYHETFGLVLLEAMEYGLPCITTPEGGIPSIVSSDNGILVKQKDSHELATAIKRLIENKEEREKMGNNGRRIFLQNYTMKTFEKNLSDILQKILSI